MSELRKSTSPDPIDQLLSRIYREAVMEVRGQYANFWLRVIARLIDTAIVLGVAFATYYSFLDFIRADNPHNADYIASRLLDAVPAFALMLWVLLYSPVMESTGGTVGKRIVGIQLVKAKNNQVPEFRYCMARTWIYLVLFVLAIVPSVVACLAVLVTPKRQAWHDRIMDLVVIHREKTNKKAA